MKPIGVRSAGNPHAAYDVAEVGNASKERTDTEAPEHCEGLWQTATPSPYGHLQLPGTDRESRSISSGLALRAVIGLHLHRPTVIQRGPGVSGMLAERARWNPQRMQSHEFVTRDAVRDLEEIYDYIDRSSSSARAR